MYNFLKANDVLNDKISVHFEIFGRKFVISKRM